MDWQGHLFYSPANDMILTSDRQILTRPWSSFPKEKALLPTVQGKKFRFSSILGQEIHKQIINLLVPRRLSINTLSMA